jgi:hypothetical protein
LNRLDITTKGMGNIVARTQVLTNSILMGYSQYICIPVLTNIWLLGDTTYSLT